MRGISFHAPSVAGRDLLRFHDMRHDIAQSKLLALEYLASQPLPDIHEEEQVRSLRRPTISELALLLSRLL